MIPSRRRCHDFSETGSAVVPIQMRSREAITHQYRGETSQHNRGRQTKPHNSHTTRRFSITVCKTTSLKKRHPSPTAEKMRKRRLPYATAISNKTLQRNDVPNPPSENQSAACTLRNPHEQDATKNQFIFPILAPSP